jgi:polar amino acid transport system permease protein
MTVLDLWTLLRAAGFTVLIAAGAIPLATVAAIILLGVGQSRLWLLRAIYVGLRWLIRGTPLLLLAMIVFYGLYAANFTPNRYVAGILAIAAYHMIFYAEVFRGAYESIPRSMFDSSRSLGLSRSATFRRVVVPLVVRQALPPYVNVCVMTIKASSILSVIGVWELTYASREITERSLAVFSVIGAAGAIYFVICFLVDRLGKVFERRLAERGFSHELRGLHS